MTSGKNEWSRGMGQWKRILCGDDGGGNFHHSRSPIGGNVENRIGGADPSDFHWKFDFGDRSKNVETGKGQFYPLKFQIPQQKDGLTVNQRNAWRTRKLENAEDKEDNDDDDEEDVQFCGKFGAEFGRSHFLCRKLS